MRRYLTPAIALLLLLSLGTVVVAHSIAVAADSGHFASAATASAATGTAPSLSVTPPVPPLDHRFGRLYRPLSRLIAEAAGRGLPLLLPDYFAECGLPRAAALPVLASRGASPRGP